MSATVAILKPESEFFSLFEGGRVPLLSPFDFKAYLERDPERLVYMADFKGLYPFQQMGICSILSQRSGVPRMDVFAEIMERGLPLRVSQTVVVECDRRMFS